MTVATHSVQKVLEESQDVTPPVKGVDPREWVYSFVKGVKIGPNNKLKSITGPSKPNNNFKATIKKPVSIKVREKLVEVPVGAELVVYHELSKEVRGWDIPVYKLRMMLASVFIRDNGHLTQVNIYMNGRVTITKRGVLF